MRGGCPPGGGNGGLNMAGFGERGGGGVVTSSSGDIINYTVNIVLLY